MDPLRAINRLSLRLSLAVAALVTILLGLGLYVLSQNHFDSMVGARRQAAQMQNRLLEIALRHQMLERRANGELITRTLHEIASQHEVQGVMILDHDGIVRQASRRELIGHRVSRQSPACMICHAKAPAERERWAVVTLPDGEALRSVRPIENRPECHACHDPSQHLNGILILDLSLAGFRAELSRQRRWMIAGTMALAVLLLAGVGLVVRRLILIRLEKLGKTARSIAAGDLATRADVRGGDTIADVARGLNEMATAVSDLTTEVRTREWELANVMNSVDDGLVVIDGECRIIAANHAFCRRVGSSPEALHGRRCPEAVRGMLPCGAEGAECANAGCLVSGRSRREVVYIPSEHGEPARIEEVHASAVFDDDGKVRQVVEIWRDITERVAEETRLAEIERLESLGTLASGFSHEVNTPLATTLACAEAIVERIDGSDHDAVPVTTVREIREIAETIRGQVLRCRKITEQFRRFSRGIPPSTEPVDLVEIVASVAAFVASTARQAAVTLHIEQGKRVPHVRANTEAVQHVVLNLLINAIQSSDARGGCVTVSYQVGGDVRVRIRDQGRGIPSQARQRLFDPFRTDRPQGTGIGLFLSRAIMHRMGGDVRLVDSQVGVGSCFEVVFVRAYEETS